MAKREKLYRNTKNEYLYLFNWEGGGFNDVWAPNKSAAIKKIAEEFPNCGLKPNLSTLKKCTYTEYQAQNRAGWMMTI